MQRRNQIKDAGFLERPKGGERALLVQIAFPEIQFEKTLAEFHALAESAGADIIDVIVGSKQLPDPKYFIGSGKAEEVRQAVVASDIQVVLVNHQLSPSQARNLERLINCRVVDRTGLILDIFAKRARTAEGMLQVELAQLEHLMTRLIRGWTHLERQKGGIGLRGPGETQLETDRRIVRQKIKVIENRLNRVCGQRDQNRSSRKRSAMPTVALVGYTNAGKSSLFNALTKSHVLVEDQLFATLDPTMRKLNLPGSSPIILIDTVGFIRDLPHVLVDSFKATLEETIQADLLLHVIDVSNPDWQQEVLAVEKVFAEIGVAGIPVIQVFNKIDALVNMQAKKDYSGKRVWVSSTTGEGLLLLQEAIIEAVYGPLIEEDITLSAEDAAIRAKLYAEKAVLTEQSTENGGFKLKIRLSGEKRKKILG